MCTHCGHAFYIGWPLQVIGVDNPHDEVEVNFGYSPFRFDLLAFDPSNYTYVDITLRTHAGAALSVLAVMVF